MRASSSQTLIFVEDSLCKYSKMQRHDRMEGFPRPQAQGRESNMPMENRSCRRWAMSIDHLLDDEDGRQAFHEFAKGFPEYKDYFDFFLACEGINQPNHLTDTNCRKMIRHLYKKFIRNWDPYLNEEEINYIKSCKECVELNRNVYDGLQLHIKNTKLVELYKIFLQSDIFIGHVNEHHPEVKRAVPASRFMSTIQQGSPLKIDRQMNSKMTNLVTEDMLSNRKMPNHPPKPVPKAFIHMSYAPNSEASSRVQSDMDPEYLECGGSIYGFPMNYQNATGTLPKPIKPPPVQVKKSIKDPEYVGFHVNKKDDTLKPIHKINQLPHPADVRQKTMVDADFFSQVANKLESLTLQSNNQEIYSRPCARVPDTNGNDSDQDILDNHIKSWDLTSPGTASPVPPIPVRRPMNSLDCANNNMMPPNPNRNLNPYATLPRRAPSGPPILPPRPTSDENKTVVIYKMMKEDIPTKTRLEGKLPTLRQLKDSVKKCGDFRYFCKIQVDKKGFHVFQEITKDGDQLPQFDNKVTCRISEMDKDFPQIRGNHMAVEVKYPMQKTIYRFNVLRTLNLREFKYSLPVLGNYRYFFETHCEELMEYDVIQEECNNDDEAVPTYKDGQVEKICCKIE